MHSESLQDLGFLPLFELGFTPIADTAVDLLNEPKIGADCNLAQARWFLHQASM